MKFYVKEKVISKTKIDDPEKVWNELKDIRKIDQETFWILGLNVQNRVICKECLFIGGLDCCSVDTKILFRHLLISGCTSFIAVHNHPSGSLNMSKSDLNITNIIEKGSDILGIYFLDHIIIGSGYFSYKQNKSIKK